MVWYDMIWYDLIWFDLIWYDMMIWYDMILIWCFLCFRLWPLRFWKSWLEGEGWTVQSRTGSPSRDPIWTQWIPPSRSVWGTFGGTTLRTWSGSWRERRVPCLLIGGARHVLVVYRHLFNLLSMPTSSCSCQCSAQYHSFSFGGTSNWMIDDSMKTVSVSWEFVVVGGTWGYLAYRFVSTRASLIAKAVWSIDEMWNRLRNCLSRVQDYRCQVSDKQMAYFSGNRLWFLDETNHMSESSPCSPSLNLETFLACATSVVRCEMRQCRIAWVVCFFIVIVDRNLDLDRYLGFRHFKWVRFWGWLPGVKTNLVTNWWLWSWLFSIVAI